MSDSGYTPSTASQFVCDDGDHHWVASHEPDAPIWVIACSVCGRHNFEEMLTAHDAVIREDQAKRDKAIALRQDFGARLQPEDVEGDARARAIAEAIGAQSFTGTEKNNGRD